MTFKIQVFTPLKHKYMKQQMSVKCQRSMSGLYQVLAYGHMAYSLSVLTCDKYALLIEDE